MKIDELKEPPIVGNYYLVPCKVYKMGYTPIINNPHSDKENGQYEKHYHIDTRFMSEKVIKHNGINLYLNNMEDRLLADFDIEYIKLKCNTTEFDEITHSFHITNSKIKHKCIHKGKCPHRGTDLSQVVPVNGIIKCPLHGLDFEEKSGRLLTDLSLNKNRFNLFLEELEEKIEWEKMNSKRYENRIVGSEWE